MIERVKSFIGAVAVEFKRISWPSKRQLFMSSLLVLVTTFLLAGYIGLVDFVIVNVVNRVLR